MINLFNTVFSLWTWSLKLMGVTSTGSLDWKQAIPDHFSLLSFLCHWLTGKFETFPMVGYEPRTFGVRSTFVATFITASVSTPSWFNFHCIVLRKKCCFSILWSSASEAAALVTRSFRTLNLTSFCSESSFQWMKNVSCLSSLWAEFSHLSLYSIRQLEPRQALRLYNPRE